MNYRLISLIFFLVFMCCSRNNTNLDIYTLSKKKLSRISEIKNTTTIVDSIYIIPLESKEDCIIGEISNVEIIKDTILIHDYINCNLFLFDFKGNFIRQIGSKGKAPNQYVNLQSYYWDYDNEIINIIDNHLGCIHTYSIKGEYINRLDYIDQNINQIDYCKYIGNNKLLCYSSPNYYNNIAFFIVDIRDFTISNILYNHTLQSNVGKIKYSISPYASHKNEIKFVTIFDPLIYSLSNDLLIPIIKIEENKKILNDKQLKTINEEMSSLFDVIDQIYEQGKYSLGCFDIFETDRFIYLKTFFNESILWDKNNDSGYIIERNNYFEWGYILSSYDNFLIQAWDMSLIKEKVDIFPDNIRKIIKTKDISDNPVLIMRKMKT